MGVLCYPRIHFRGKININPATANNDDVRVLIDPVNVKLNPTIACMSDTDALAWLTEGVPAVSMLNQTKFEYLRGGWNPYGDLTTQFVDVSVCSTIGADGQLSPSDPLVGSWLILEGSPPQSIHDPPSLPKVCDLDPSGSAVTQLYFGGFRIGNKKLGVQATCDRKAFSRWIAFRNAVTYPGEQNFPGAGAVWQFTIPKGDLHFHGADNERSPVLAELKAAADRALGIVVQFATFKVIPTLSDEQLIASLENPLNSTSNPAIGLIVGTVGVWEKGEPATTPDGRLLLPFNDQALLLKKAGPAAAFLGPATAQVQRGRKVVSLNLIATFPENGYQFRLTKADFGRVRLGVIPKDKKEPTVISDPIEYDYGSYELTAGIIDVRYDSVDENVLDDGTLVLVTDPDQDGTRFPILVEIPEVVTVMSVGDDDKGVYLDKGDSTKLSIVVRERGRPPTENVTVYLWEFQYVTIPGDQQSRAISILREVGAGMALTNRLAFDSTVVFRRGKATALEIDVEALAPGAAVIAFTLDDNPPTGDYPWGTARYAGIRVLPDDNYDHESKTTRVSWAFMYDEVFRFYRLIFPAMSTAVDFSNEKVMESAAEIIYELTDPSLKESTCYMPVSRDLSTGKRGLIEEWYKQVKAKAAKPHLHKPPVVFRRYFWP